MKITRNVAVAGVAGALTLSGIALVAAPVATAATVAAAEDGTDTVGSRLQAITEALAGLVTDGSITQEQADEVAATLDASDALRGPGGPGGDGGRGIAVDVAAETLGMTGEELRTALAVEGTTLADVAAAQGVDTSALVDALVAAATERITQAVTDGRITQERADSEIAALPERVGAMVEDELAFRGGPGHGPRGDRVPGGGTTDDGTTDDATAEGTSLTT
ncbi:MAG: hypothetical protein JWP95_1706 [Actinotalea sp.]|nr:hypothetical protein [Actinotalea sp.]